MDNTEAKKRILETVVSAMQENQDIGKLTNRQIAEKAGVNSALINYYFKSKDNLLIEAVNICMGNLFENIIQKTSKEIAKDRLKVVLIHDRANISPEVMQALKNDIIEVISHYMDINKNEMEISLENDDNSVALLANIPVNRIKNQAKR